ncbi:hypothetical protein BH11MYX1_BH11MYX1_44360 [soil metagenome]
MSPLLRIIISGFGVGRIAIGLAPFVAAGPSSRLIGFPSAHDTATARLMGRFFGVRDIGLGILTFYGLRHVEAMGFIMLFNALMDFGDLFAIAIPLIKRQGIDLGAVVSAVFAASGGLGWLIAYFAAGSFAR